MRIIVTYIGFAFVAAFLGASAYLVYFVFQDQVAGPSGDVSGGLFRFTVIVLFLGPFVAAANTGLALSVIRFRREGLEGLRPLVHRGFFLWSIGFLMPLCMTLLKPFDALGWTSYWGISEDPILFSLVGVSVLCVGVGMGLMLRHRFGVVLAVLGALGATTIQLAPLLYLFIWTSEIAIVLS